MNRRRRLAFFTACNIDGAHWMSIERGRDCWWPDPRLAETEQTNDAHYANRLIDRGHLVRREDPNWGPLKAEVLKANADTFHFTNASPQHAVFNQRPALWHGLEDFVLRGTVAAQRRAIVFTGPVFEPADPVLDEVHVPLVYWKILVFRREDGTLSASGFTMDQSGLIRQLNAFAPVEHQVPLAHVSARTGLDFTGLLPHDAFPTERRNTVGGASPAILLRSLEDIHW
jgi:endonuclease G